MPLILLGLAGLGAWFYLTPAKREPESECERLKRSVEIELARALAAATAKDERAYQESIRAYNSIRAYVAKRCPKVDQYFRNIQFPPWPG